MSFIIEKEKANYKLAKQLCEEGCITTPGPPFQASNKQEIRALSQEEFSSSKSITFKLRIVNEVKGKATNALYEKSQLIIQGYNNDSKEVILMQLLTI